MAIESLFCIFSIVEGKGVYLMPEQSGHHQLIFEDLVERINKEYGK